MYGFALAAVSGFLRRGGGGSCALFFIAAGLIAGFFYIADSRRAREMKRICAMRKGDEEEDGRE